MIWVIVKDSFGLGGTKTESFFAGYDNELESKFRTCLMKPFFDKQEALYTMQDLLTHNMQLDLRVVCLAVQPVIV